MPASASRLYLYRPATLIVLTALLVTLLPIATPPPLASAAPPAFAGSRLFGSGEDFTQSIATGDMDGDGDLDIVVANFISIGGVSSGRQSYVLLNDGAGRIPIGPVSCGVTPQIRCFGNATDVLSAIAIGDMDGDGSLDIVTASYGRQSAVYLNDGTGNFIGVSPGCGLSPRLRCYGGPNDTINGLALADVNGDGALDVAAARIPLSPGPTSQVFLNDGSGTLSAGPALGDSGSAQALAGDLDADGDVDLVLRSAAGTSHPVLRNNGEGRFAADGTLSGPLAALALGDLDADGDLDLLGTDGATSATVFLNDSRGRFAAQTPFAVSNATALAIGDLDLDGDLDFAAGTGTTFVNAGAASFSAGPVLSSEPISALTLADIDGDGDLDPVIARRLQPGQGRGYNAVVVNDGAGSMRPASGVGVGEGPVVVGDVNGDSLVDVAQTRPLGQGAVYLNNGGGSFVPGPVACGTLPNVRCFGPPQAEALALASADIDSDRDLDLIVGFGLLDQFGETGRQSVVYLNDGAGNYAFGNGLSCTTSGVRCFGGPTERYVAVATGDIDGDSDLDIVALGDRSQSAVFLNDGAGNFANGSGLSCATAGIRCFGEGSETSFGAADVPRGLALGDLDADGDLDIVVGVEQGQSRALLNDGTGHFLSGTFVCGVTLGVRCFGDTAAAMSRIALGDMDGNGSLDIAGNALYLNDGAANFYTGLVVCGVTPGVRCFGTAAQEGSGSKVIAHMDADGDLDLVDGRRQTVLLNDGAGNLVARRDLGGEAGAAYTLAAGDFDRDGDTDIVGMGGVQSRVFLNSVAPTPLLPNNLPRITVSAPNGAAVQSGPIIVVPFTLSDPESDPVRAISITYSLDGGDNWRVAIPASGTITSNLAAPAVGAGYAFNWDLFASGLFGQSDNVVLRLIAYPSLRSQPRGLPAPQRRPFAVATSLPFRIRGTQIRIMRGNDPVAGALVYRLPAGQSRGARPLGGQASTFLSDGQGYLQGRSVLNVGPEGDRLMAILPITATESYTLAITSAQPASTGLNLAAIEAPGTYTATVSVTNPLLLLNLTLSLEWDARNDTQFLEQLRRDLMRASELLFDWTDGQVALGNLTIKHNREDWEDADIRIYASNRLRPNATQGGIVSSLLIDPASLRAENPITPALDYRPGSIRIGAIWNRFGDPSGSLGEDWPRALAHELAHFALFLDDNYLGLNDQNVLTTIEGCPGAMSDPYRDDYSEFHPDPGWSERCAGTLANLITGRSDWATIKAFYDRPELGISLNQPASFGANPGPTVLPLALTTITEQTIVTPSATLDAPLFALQNNDSSRYLPSDNARAFLLSKAGDRISDLGGPTLDLIQARGAHLGDRLCVFDLERTSPYLGCQTINPGETQLTMRAHPDWRPDVTVIPESATTIGLIVTGVPAGLELTARFFPHDVASTEAAIETNLTPEGDGYRGVLTAASPEAGAAGLIHIVVREQAPRREIVVDYALGGNPIRRRIRRAPATSLDGQVTLFGPGLDNASGLYAVQAATRVPTLPVWASRVGRAYRLLSGNPDLFAPGAGVSLSMSYLDGDVPASLESGLRIFYRANGSNDWQPLTTTVNQSLNEAAAPVQGPGLYVLLTSLAVRLPQAGWNNFAYPLRETRPVTEALASIAGRYTTVYGYTSSDRNDPWKVYDVGVPFWVNDLRTLNAGQGYWLNVTEPLTIELRGDETTSLLESESIPYPPATYFAVLRNLPGVPTQPDLPVRAFVGAAPCGETRTQQVGAIAFFVIDVFSALERSGCGVAGSTITFTVDGIDIGPTATWRTGRPQTLTPIRLYLSVMQR